MPRNSDNPPKPDDLNARITELERVVKALLKGMQEAEKETGEELMPEGSFYGIEFKD